MFLLYDQQDGIVTLTMNRPEERNALSESSQMDEFVDICDRINRDLSVKAVILTGAGSAFSAGGNVKHMRDKKYYSAGSPAQIRNTYRHGIQRIPLALYNLDVPAIAAINGHAIGAGLDLACMCDVRIAADTAKMASSFVKLGIVPGDGGAWLLTRVVGPTKAVEMMLTGDTLDAQAALACGLVSKVVSGERLLEEARAFAQRFAVNPAMTIRLTKRLIRESAHTSLNTSLEMAAAYQALAHYTKDHDEAVAAFLDKRPPRFTGE